MPKRSSKKKKDAGAVALGRKGGKASAKARMENLSAKERSEQARKAALARWRGK